MPKLGSNAEALAAQSAVVALSIPEVKQVLIKLLGSYGEMVIVSSQNALSGGQVTSIDAAADPVKVAYWVKGQWA